MSAVLDTPVAVRRTAMDLLARREHGRVELTRKLRQRGAPEELIQPELDRLAEEGLLSEARYLESFIRYRSNSGYGPARIREELGQRGLDRNDVDQALRDSEVNWAERLQDVWQRKFAGQRPHDPRSRAQQTRFLAYRGFSMEMIGRLLSGRDLDDY
ncbi:recombination regulator RecX [Pseudomonas sp. SWI6]|uniref:Regulatory protein RecX n=1 Tax=Pseudomonas taiwanensis TaxID=470150 RepID=A0ABR6VBG8_9PSED|nr:MULTISPECIES: recombination regulator RecX [Pseudomonas]AGZ36642.1 recombination regulator RecX [Pseudomonas sp. VLB120]AVD82015.1 recombination regulator RecX [Pseudomonas sp. SWI6]AVD88968.1 recombination regulator RecX [Pseudomonas sp. SWI44]MBC3477734.1 recombination regulator RecX [Pseudomonas taiwanensis]MBC3493815.1 recombination regulator RecX [Pseudomonas taiwanensis]